MIEQNSLDKLIEVTKEILNTKYPSAEFAFLAGSILRGEGTAFSDLDIIIIFADLPDPYRESFYFQGFPVETFVHTPDSLNAFFERDGKDGVPSLAVMVSEGVVVPNEKELSNSLKQTAEEILANPPPLTKSEIDILRYQVTDLLDDIRDPRSKAELIGAGTGHYQDLADFYLRTNGYWSAKRKSVPRYLNKANPEFCQRFVDSFEELFALGRTEKVIELAEELLNQHGGLFFDGFRLEASGDWRKTNE
jgi:predicted nucleotidyltransferase